MSKIAFIYPGQGAQKAGMGKDFYEADAGSRGLFDAASEALQLDIRELCFEENDRLHQTEYTQAAMVTTCLAMTDVLLRAGITPDVTAGLSLGEYCAIAAAGAMAPLDAVRLVRKRGILMQEAVPDGRGSMAAILGLGAREVEEAIAEIADVAVANYNCPGQIVITGYTEAVEQANEALLAAGAKRAVTLQVSGPFHSVFLQDASEKLNEALDAVELTPLQHPYVSNVTAALVDDTAEIKELLVRQMYSPVRWEQSMREMLTQGVDTFIEIGPGRTLAGFLRKIDRSAVCLSLESWEDIAKLTEHLQK
ncbi:MAG: ACP S-malonyltransferase [Lachnospiraceae bacterium]